MTAKECPACGVHMELLHQSAIEWCPHCGTTYDWDQPDGQRTRIPVIIEDMKTSHDSE